MISASLLWEPNKLWMPLIASGFLVARALEKSGAGDGDLCDVVYVNSISRRRSTKKAVDFWSGFWGREDSEVLWLKEKKTREAALSLLEYQLSFACAVYASSVFPWRMKLPLQKLRDRTFSVRDARALARRVDGEFWELRGKATEVKAFTDEEWAALT